MLRGVTRVMMVEVDEVVVEARLVAGEYRCPACGGRLRPWGFARWRAVRVRSVETRVRPRRSRCASCLVTHVLLATMVLLRRRDHVGVIGESLVARFVDGRSRAKVAEAAGVHRDTLRGWTRRFVARAEGIRVCFTELAHGLDGQLGAIEARGSPAVDALEAIGVAAGAATRRLGPAALWEFVAGASGGLLLANTNVPLPLGG